VNELSPSTTTIKVIVRHGTKCKREHPGLRSDYKDCNCRKSIYIYENGEDHPIAAKTRSWSEAQKIAQEEIDKRNPDKQELMELKARLAAVQAEAEAAAAKKALTIEKATERWLNAQKGVEIKTASTHRWVVGRVRAWAKDNKIETVADVTPDNLSKWREDWSPVAEKPFSRLEPSTQVTFQSYLKGIFRYVVSLGQYLEKSPAEGLKPIKTKGKPVIPLSPSQFEELLAAIPTCCAADNGILHGFAAELRALCLLHTLVGTTHRRLRCTAEGGARRQPAKPNTVHLTKVVAFCMGQRQEAADGAYGCPTPSGCPDHGLHQPWRNNQNVSFLQHRAGAFKHRKVQHSSARSASAGGCLLRHRSGAVHAIVLSRGIALSAGSSPVAARSIGRCAGGWQSGNRLSP